MGWVVWFVLLLFAYARVTVNDYVVPAWPRWLAFGVYTLACLIVRFLSSTGNGFNN